MVSIGISSVLDRMSYLDYNRQEGYHTPPPHFPDHPRHPEVSYHYYQEYRGAGVESVCYVEKVYLDQARPDVYHVERLYPDACHPDNFHSYENPSSPTPATVGLVQPRTPQRIIYTHRRTPSNVSDHSSSSSNVNPMFRMEDNENESENLSHSLPPPSIGPFHAPYVTVITSLPNTPRRKNSQDSTVLESSGSYRSLAYTKLKSSLDSTSSPTRGCLIIPPSAADGTPTNGTPIHSSRSSSNDDNGSTSRVRFSIDESEEPVVKTVNKASGTDDIKSLLDIPADGQSQDATVPLSDVMKISDQRQSSVR